MSLLLQKSGILTTVQDLGRTGVQRFGINPTGVMDRAATRLINILLGNDDNEAVLEMHFPAPEIYFETDTIAAIGGGDFAATLDGQPIENWRTFFAKTGSNLRFMGKISCNRAYLSVKGGFKTDRWLGSSSTNLAAHIGGYAGQKLGSVCRIELRERAKRSPTVNSRRIASSILPVYRPFPTVRVIAGAEFGCLDQASRDSFLNRDLTISKDSDRMGFRLLGDSLTSSRRPELISSAVSFGTIQLLPNGQLIVLMADHQTTGGYPRIAHVISNDLPLLAQLGANDKVAFHLIEIEEAERLAIEFERDLAFLRVGVQF